MSRIILTAINDHPRYQTYLKVFLESLAEWHPTEAVRAYAVNTTDEYVQSLVRINPMVDARNPKRERFDGSEASHVRGEMIDDALVQGYETVVWMDNDIVLKGRIDKLWADVRPECLKIRYRPSQPVEIRRFQDGVYVIGNGEYTRAIFRALRAKLQKHHEWYADQHYLYVYWRKFRKHVKLIPMLRRFNDNRMGVKSLVWHASLKVKESKPEFNAEHDRLLAAAERKLANGNA